MLISSKMISLILWEIVLLIVSNDLSSVDSVILVVTSQIGVVMSVRLDELSLAVCKVMNRSFSCAISNWDLRIGKKSVISCCLE